MGSQVVGELAIPKGSIVVVSGANGYIASNVVDQLLTIGYPRAWHGAQA
jgi:hypothetical protein